MKGQNCNDTCPSIGITETFIIETDASNVGVGVELIQLDHSMMFVSKGLSSKQQLFSAYENELLVILGNQEVTLLFDQHTFSDQNRPSKSEIFIESKFAKYVACKAIGIQLQDNIQEMS